MTRTAARSSYDIVLDVVQRMNPEEDFTDVSADEAAAVGRERMKYQYARRLGQTVGLSPRLERLFGLTEE